MPSVREFPLPDLGEGLTSAEIVRWLVEVGDVIAVDQPVAEVETAKAVVEVPCPYGGVVTARFGEEGTEVPVGAALVTVAVSPRPGAPSDDPSTGSASSGSAPSSSASSGSGNVLVGYGTSESSSTGRRRRVTHPAATATRTPPVVVSRSPQVPTPAVAVISPLVRRLAREHAIDLTGLTGSGPEGLILRSDVDTAIADRSHPAAPTHRPGSVSAASAASAADAEVIPLKGVARLAAATFTRSRREIPDATCWVDADATALLAARDTLNAGAAPQDRIGLLPLLARICTAGLARHPELNSSVVTAPDGTATGLRRHTAVHLGFAAQTERGLAVPVVHDAHLRSTADLAAEMTRLTAAARTGRLTPAELTGGTFTLNNYGVFGVDGSTPIINHPEAAMLGVGRIAEKPWVHQGELAVRQVVQLSFTFDHRVCDGATAGAFLRFVADAVESPTTLLRHL